MQLPTPATLYSLAGTAQPALLEAQPEGDYELREVSSPDALLEQCRSRPPDAVLLDNLQNTSQLYQCCSAIKALPLESPIPVLMIIPARNPVAQARALQAGADDYIEAPLHSRALRHRVERLLATRCLQGALRCQMERYADLDTFSHALAHELRSPLNLIANLASMVMVEEENSLPASGREHLQKIQVQIRRMSQMVEQMLLAAQEPASRDVVTLIAVSAVMRAAISRCEDMIEEAGVRVTVVQPLPILTSNPRYLEEIFTQLIANAVKYRRRDIAEPVILLRATREGERVRFEVEDNGVGISPEQQQQVFAMHRRLQPQMAQGYGIGLAVAKRFVQRLGGSIGVETSAAGGSIFWFSLPDLK